MGTLPVPTLINSILTLLVEAYAGPPNPKETWFIDNDANAGILNVLSAISAAEASAPVVPAGGSGTTIASNVEHLRWSLANANNAFRGGAYNPNWGESWALLDADEEKWAALRTSLRSEFEAMVAILRQQDELPGEYLNGVLALIPHAAYHLGVIRQMLERVRERPLPA